jgi:hypothetical protein
MRGAIFIPRRIADLRDVDHSTRANGRDLVWDEAAQKHTYLPRVAPDPAALPVEVIGDGDGAAIADGDGTLLSTTTPN